MYILFKGMTKKKNNKKDNKMFKNHMTLILVILIKPF